MGIVEGQVVVAKWNSANKGHYVNLGYKYTRMGEEFEVKITHLTKGSHFFIKLTCDYCGELYSKKYHKFLIDRDNCTTGKDCCSRKCLSMKIRELYGNVDEEPYDKSKEEPRKELGLSKEFLISEFWRYKSEYKVYPRLSDFKASSNYPSPTGYNRLWGNWLNFLIDIKIKNSEGWYFEDINLIKDKYENEKYSLSDIENELIEKRSWKEIKIKAKQLGLTRKSFYEERKYPEAKTREDRISIAYEVIKDLQEDLNRVPTIYDYDNYSKINNILSRRNLEKNVGMTFSNICFNLFSERNKEIKTKTQLIDELTELK